MSGRSVTLVGGGVATLMLGVELRARRPDLPVTLITADTPAHAGGHLASWDEQGHPVEHGFHALFECYDTALALLDRHGLSGNFVRGPSHFFVYDGGGLQRVGHGLASALAPASLAERARGALALPAVARLVDAVARRDADVIAALDAEDFRAALLRCGIAPSFVESSTVRMFYDFGFVGDGPLSAAVAFGVLGHLLRGGRMRHFTGPSRPTLIDPLRARFEALGGAVVDRTLVTRVHVAGGRARAIDLQGPDGAVTERPVDELVLGLAVESMKRMGWAGEVPGFARDLRRLDGAESLSLQAWFDDDPVPESVDSVVGGLPEPWSTLCPQTRVRGQRRGPHGHELIACGPATGFERAPDEALVDRFFATIERLGFRVPRGRAGVHVALRRNGGAADRYLLTRPGELWLRPAPVTSVPNLSLVGAWLRVPFTMPSVEAVAQSVVQVRDAIEQRLPRAAAPTSASWELVPPPPYRHDGLTRVFPVAVDPDALAARLPPELAPAPGFAATALWFATHYADAYAVRDPAAVRHRANELMLAAVVRTRGDGARPPGLFPVALYIDSDVAMAVGREVYGFAKRHAALSLDDVGLTVTRPIALDGELHTAPRALVTARWRRGERFEGPAARLAAGALATLLDAAGGVSLYNRARGVAPPGLRAPLVRDALLRTRAFDVRLGPATRLSALCAEVAPGRGEPLRALLPRGATAFEADEGAEFEIGFSIDGSEEVSGS